VVNLRAGSDVVCDDAGRRDIVTAALKAVQEKTSMAKFLLWLILLVLCWPLALLALILYPVVWLLLTPFRLAGIVVTGVFEFLRAVIMLPARLLRGLTRA
jgi:hypothetical protein